MAYIDFQNVTKVYGIGEAAVFANKDIDFEIEAGEFVVILGPSGAGKSTTLNLLGGMDQLTSGKIIVAGQELSRLDDDGLAIYRRDKVGFIFQFYNLIPNLTVLENVEMSEQISHKANQAQKYLTAVGLSHRLHNFPAQLSGGEQQRTAIARALVKEPSLLLCDEPTGALDKATGQQILQLLLEQNKALSTTVIVITHNPSIANIANKVISIKDGKIESIELNPQPLTVAEIDW